MDNYIEIAISQAQFNAIWDTATYRATAQVTPDIQAILAMLRCTRRIIADDGAEYYVATIRHDVVVTKDDDVYHYAIRIPIE